MEHWAHFTEDLVRLMEQRGVEPSSLIRVRCKRCGVVIDAHTAMTTGLVHWPDCFAESADIRFIRRRKLLRGEQEV